MKVQFYSSIYKLGFILIFLRFSINPVTAQNVEWIHQFGSEGDDIAAIPAETASVLNVLRSMSRSPRILRKMPKVFWQTFPEWPAYSSRRKIRCCMLRNAGFPALSRRN